MFSIKVNILLLLCFVTVSAGAQNLDVDILKSINPHNPDSKFWDVTSNSAYWMPAAASFGTLVTGFINDDKKMRQRGCELLISVGVSSLISEAVKRTFNRTRPADKYPNEIFVNDPVHGKSFPSGHTSLAFATATTLSLQYKKWYVTAPCFLWASLVGYSRMYKGKHYPSDVGAGILVGIGSGLLSHYLTKKIFRH